MEKWLLIDGNNLVFRQFYAISELKSSSGFPTNAIYGWIRSLWKLEEQEKPQHKIVFFDIARCSFRLKLLPTYKANRKEMPEDLKRQLPVIKELTWWMGYSLSENENFEADDGIAAAAHKITQKSESIVKIVSADKDFAQCVTPHVTLLIPTHKTENDFPWQPLDTRGVEEKFGAPPHRIVDLLALIGDNSDNIPGIEGVGPKTAAQWLQKYPSLESLIQNASGVTPARFVPKIMENQDAIMRNRELVTLRRECPWSPPQEPSCEPERLIQLLESLEMRSMVSAAKKYYGNTLAASAPKPLQTELW